MRMLTHPAVSGVLESSAPASSASTPTGSVAAPSNLSCFTDTSSSTSQASPRASPTMSPPRSQQALVAPAPVAALGPIADGDSRMSIAPVGSEYQQG